MNDQINSPVIAASTTDKVLGHKKNNDIETLRAISIIFVMFSHMGFLLVGARNWDFYWNHFGTYSGVDLFFTISGFIISKSYYEKFVNAKGSELLTVTSVFWIKRAFRLWPSAWLWLALMTVEFTLFGITDFWKNFVDAISSVLLLANFHWWMCLSGEGQCGGITIYWSLSLEEQFYILFPLIFLLPRKFHLWIFLGIAMVQIPLKRLAWSGDFFWFTRTDAIALGVCIYLISTTKFYASLKPVFLEKKRIAIVVVSAIVIFLATVTPPVAFPTHSMVPFSTGLIALLSGLLVLMASYDSNWFYDIPVIRPILLWIGARSYALYLLHIFVFQAMGHLVARKRIAEMFPGHWLQIFYVVGTLALIGIAAELNFRLLENPMRLRGAAVAKRFSMRRKLEAA